MWIRSVLGWILVLKLALIAPASLAAEARLGGQAPFFFVNTYNPKLSGSKRIFFDKLVGQGTKEPKKLVLLTFFDIDCKPCRKELPFLQELFERYRKMGLGVVAVNCDYANDKIEELKSYIQEIGLTFPVLKDRFQALRRRYGVKSYPTMFIIESSGKIVDIRVGYDPKKKPFPLAWVERRLGVEPGSGSNPDRSKSHREGARSR